jgi:hypothetical protein
MSEELEQQEQQITPQDTHQETPQDPTVEDLAREMGWNPEHEGPDKLSADEFVRRKPLFDKIKQQGKELKEIRRMLEKVTTTSKLMSEAQYKRGIADATKRMKAAEDTLDINAFKQAATEKAQLEQGLQQVSTPDIPPEVEEWCNNNKWFDENDAMQADALAYREQYVRVHPNAPISKVLQYVEQKIKKDYPEAFEAEKPKPAAAKPSTPAVESGGNSGGKVDPFAKLKNAMSAEEKRIMKQFIGPGKMTESEYLEQYATVRGEK